MIYSMYWAGNYPEYVVPLSYGTDSFRERYGNHPDYRELIPLAGKTLYLRKELANFIRESVDDSFVFILTKKGYHYDAFKLWLSSENLEDYVVCHPDKGVTNPNYYDAKAYGVVTVGNLRLVVMASKNHSMREEFIASKPELIKKFNSNESAI